MKTLVIGGTNDFGTKFTRQFGDSALGIGRSNGYDISNEGRRQEIKAMSLEYDLIVALTHGDHFQNLMVEEIFRHWLEKEHTGYLFAIGSIATYFDSENRSDITKQYIEEKRKLSEIAKKIAWRSHLSTCPIRFSTIHVGMLDCQKSRSHTKFTRGITPEELANLIKMYFQMPKHLCIHECYFETSYEA